MTRARVYSNVPLCSTQVTAPCAQAGIIHRVSDSGLPLTCTGLSFCDTIASSIATPDMATLMSSVGQSYAYTVSKHGLQTYEAVSEALHGEGFVGRQHCLKLVFPTHELASIHTSQCVGYWASPAWIG